MSVVMGSYEAPAEAADTFYLDVQEGRSGAPPPAVSSAIPSSHERDPEGYTSLERRGDREAGRREGERLSQPGLSAGGAGGGSRLVARAGGGGEGGRAAGTSPLHSPLPGRAARGGARAQIDGRSWGGISIRERT